MKSLRSPTVQKEADERSGNIAVVVAAFSMVLLAFAVVGLKVPNKILAFATFMAYVDFFLPYFPHLC